MGFLTYDWLERGKRSLITDSFKTSSAFSPAASRKPPAGTGNLGAKVGTLFPASPVNSPRGHRYPPAGAAADDNLTASTILSQGPPPLPPAPRGPPTPCTNLAPRPGPARLPTPAPLDSRCFRVCAKRRGGARSRLVRPGVPPPGSPGSFSTLALRRESPAFGQSLPGPLSR